MIRFRGEAERRNMVKSTNAQPSSKFFREMEKKAAVSDAEKARKATLKKTEKLRELRLAKEAEDRAAEAARPAKTKTEKKKKLPAIEREV
ncbi:MAG: hypothetical protein JKX88_10460 [Marinicaulis sp.]|nr:hypothetical protein [Marinicaulis sp.]